MKKILYSIVALMFVGSVAFAGITVAGQGSVKFNLLKGVKVGTDEKGENRGQITLFDDWDLSDNDVWIIGETANGIAGGQINLSLLSDAYSIIMQYTEPNWVPDTEYDRVINAIGLPIMIGDWDVWVKPFDFMTIKALNYGVRSMDRYVDIISELKDGYGVLRVGRFNTEGDILSGGGKWENPLSSSPASLDELLNFTIEGSDADKLSGFILDMNFDVVQVELGLSASEADGYSKWYAPVMLFADDKSSFNMGARVTFPVADILKGSVLYKTDIDTKKVGLNISRNVIGAYVDIYAIENLNLVVGFTGDYISSKNKTTEKTSDVGAWSMNGIDLRAQYNMDKMGFAAHQNFTFGSTKEFVSDKTYTGPYFAMKTKLGFLYKITDSLDAVVEASNTYAKFGTRDDEYNTMDTMVIYPRVAFELVPGVELNAGLKGTFDLSIKRVQRSVTETANFKRSIFEVPLSMKVSFN
ncbi:MAG: hypothetical protein IAA16_02160 [Candidatus Treponema excrementipullorum]|uniref:DUF5723 domain-containing protein n=1 Tax=Candidatus Treponema excrementipullorum TaxID=2838768 RepID=A0A9E2L1E1_9SPIR|nr:hypothetical protein [Candidatus Treponema excrementipullorum]